MNFYSVARSTVKVLLKFIYPVEVIGDIDKIPSEGGVIVSANHLSYLDAIFLGITLKRQIRFVGKDKYAKSFPLKYIFKWLGAFGIDPEKADLSAIKQCFNVVKNGEVLGIFPEGTRIIGDKVSNPMPGAAMIAHKTKTPIFYFRIKPSSDKIKPFRKTYLYVGEKVTCEQLGVTTGKGNEYKEASVKLMNLIYGLGE